MRRFILLFLLAVLPLQMAWAGVAHCPRGEDQGAPASASGNSFHTVDAHHHDGASDTRHGHQHGKEDGTAGYADGFGLDCSLFHFVAVEPPSAQSQLRPHPGVAVTDMAHPGHKSHIPDGLDRPNWRFAA